MSRPPAKPSMKFSILAGREVDTNSEEWKHECEVRFLASQTQAKLTEIFEEPGKGMKFKRSDAAVTRLKQEIERYRELQAKV